MYPRIVAISGPLKGEWFPLGACELFIGRGKSCDIRLDDPLVSTKHCGISREGERPLLRDLQSATGLFVNGFYFPAKMLLSGDRFRVGRSIFVYLEPDDPDVDRATLMRTPAEEEWDRKLDFTQSGQRKEAYEAAMSTVLDAFLEFNGKINAGRDADEIQSRMFELIFRVMPLEGVAILLRDPDTGILSTTYRRLVSPTDEPFSIDETVIGKALRDGGLVYSDKVVCLQLSTPSAKVGLLYAVMSADSNEWFTGSHLRLLEAVAGSAAVALERARYVAWLEGENRRLNEVINVEHGMIGRSDKMQKIYQLVGRAGASDRTVLIRGESGTGKELVARALHRNSPRAQKPLHSVNCAAFTDTLLGSELFGHEKGAFTGADKLRKGLFEVADGGTVFLDEIGECSLTLQADLLRLLQEHEFKRVGGTQVLHANVRIIAATNVDLERAMKEGRFRPDLYFRLNVIRIDMPRLAERREDIPLLIAEFIKKHGNIRSGNFPRVQGVTPEVHQIFATYDWPGNVRELGNVIEGAIALGSSSYIGREDLPLSLTLKPSEPAELGQWDAELNACKKMIIEKALQKTNFNRAEAARLLDLNAKYFSALCKELHVK